MIYRGIEINDIETKTLSRTIRVIDGVDHLDLTSEDIECLKKELEESTKYVTDWVKNIKGVKITDPKIRITTHEGYDEDGYGQDPYAEIELMWTQTESDEERDKRIKISKRLIDKQIKRDEKDAENRLLNIEARRKKSIESAIELLRSNGFNVEPPM